MKATVLLLLAASVALGGEVLNWPEDAKDQWEAISVAKLPPGVAPQDPEDSERPLTTVDHVQINWNEYFLVPNDIAFVSVGNEQIFGGQVPSNSALRLDPTEPQESKPSSRIFWPDARASRRAR